MGVQSDGLFPSILEEGSGLVGWVRSQRGEGGVDPVQSVQFGQISGGGVGLRFISTGSVLSHSGGVRFGHLFESREVGSKGSVQSSFMGSIRPLMAGSMQALLRGSLSLCHWNNRLPSHQGKSRGRRLLLLPCAGRKLASQSVLLHCVPTPLTHSLLITHTHSLLYHTRTHSFITHTHFLSLT